jgi:DNA polymerase III subunit gamma/tau
MRYETHWEFLKNSAALGKLSHAYIFSGNDEVGQQRLALKLSQLLNCEARLIGGCADEAQKGEPCQACASCKGMREKTHPDAVWISETREIPISAIRGLRSHFSLSSWQSPFKVAVIEKAHLMNTEAQSALLKLLEEPRKNAILLLLCEYPDLLLDTIRSRAQEIRWYSFPATAKEDGKYAEELKRLKDSFLQERFDYAKKAAETSQDAIYVLEGWMRAQRSFLLKSISDVSENIAQEERVVKTIQEMLRVVSTTNVTPRLALEQVLLEL